jgi:lysophospholipase L1-like esterase
MKWWQRILFALAVGAMALLLGEALIWVVCPTEYMYPRYQFSLDYGLIPFPNVTMVHGIPRRFEYHYSTGSLGCRGELPAPARARRPVVVILGDSNSFGMGVADGEEYPTVMQRALGDNATVVNLGEPGWGLTQEVRRFVEVGEAYDPEFVVLQFGSNDPEDNLINRVALVRDGELVFVPSNNSLNGLKKYLSRSFLQRTQLYNFMRVRAAQAFLGTMARREEARLEPAVPQSQPDAADPTAIERVHIELLDAFAERLHADGRTLIIISVGHHLEMFPGIDAAVHDLVARDRAYYVEVLDFLAGLGSYRSPEGHAWGPTAHQAIGEGLAGVVEEMAARTDSTDLDTGP